MNKKVILFLTDLNSRHSSEFEAHAKKVLLTPEKKDETCLSFIHELKVPQEVDHIIRKKRPQVVVIKGIPPALAKETVSRIRRNANGHAPKKFFSLGVKIDLPGIEMIGSIEEVEERLPVLCS